MSDVNLSTREGSLSLVFNFYANRQYERKTGETAPQFVRECMMSQMKTHHLLSMLECCLIKEHPKLKGAKLERAVEKFIDSGNGSFADIVTPLIEAITESGMFRVNKKDDDVEVDNEDLDGDDPDDVARALGGEVDERDGKEVRPAEDDPST